MNKYSMTLFQRLKKFINHTHKCSDGTFSTRDMCKFVDEPTTHPTGWKRWNKNPNYTTHMYLGQLRELGCVTRIKHGHYKINSPIPDWFGSYHFNGLKGKLNDPSNFYWNSLPSFHKVNPWSVRKELSALLPSSATGASHSWTFDVSEEPKQIRIEDALGAWPEWDPQQDNKLRAKYPANVEGSLDQRIAAMQSRLDDQIAKLQDIKNAIIELKALADEQNQVELRYTSEHVNHTYEVTYLGDEYRVIHTYNSDDVYDEYWKVDNYHDDEIDNKEIAEYLIDWVKQNCK
jgi:hypothetical protein